jgi:hypothetical protein
LCFFWTPSFSSRRFEPLRKCAEERILSFLLPSELLPFPFLFFFHILFFFFSDRKVELIDENRRKRYLGYFGITQQERKLFVAIAAVLDNQLW